MPSLGKRQRSFGAAVLDAALPVPAGLVGPDGEPSARRFAVYRNNVIVGMIETLRAAFPVVHRLVGPEFFNAVAALYGASHPPGTPILMLYGEGFADFLAGFEPLASLPYVADVARIERAWVEAYNAPEREPLTVTELTAIDLHRVGEVQFVPHPSLRVIRSDYPALTIWNTNLEGATPVPVDLEAGGQDVLVLRPAAEVEARPMPPGAAAFLTGLMAGATVSEAAASGYVDDGNFDLSTTLSGLIEAEAFVDWDYASYDARASNAG